MPNPRLPFEHASDIPTTLELVREAISEAKELVQLELQLARGELVRELMQLRRGVLLGALALVLTLTALSTLAFALVLRLGGTALVALIVGGVLLAGAVVLGAIAYRAVPKVPLERTRARLKADIVELKDHAGLLDQEAGLQPPGALPSADARSTRPVPAPPISVDEEPVPPSSRRLIEPNPKRAPAKPPTPLIRRLKSIASILKETGAEWSKDDATRLAASLAVYTLLSIAPLLVIAVSVAGLVFGGEAARGQISQQISGLVGPEAGKAIEALISNARSPSAGVLSTIIGTAVLLFGASGVFGELQSALNRIWEVQPKPGRGIMGILRDRFLSFSMVMGVAFLLLVSLVVSAGLAGLTKYLGSLVPMPVLWHAFDVIVGLGLTTVLFALTFKVVPDVKITWRDVWVGGFATAIAFTVGRIALAWYVGRSSTVSPFGAAGSLVALVVWVYYSAQILFMGAEFAQVYAAHYGSRIVPAKNAVPLDH